MRFWDTSNPAKPTGPKDPDAVLDYPVSFAAWLADASASYASHTVSVTGGLVVDSSSENAGVITPWLSGGSPGETASFTIHISSAAGRKDDRTFYLEIADR